MQGSILIPSIFLGKTEAESSEESKNERGVEGEEKREIQTDSWNLEDPADEYVMITISMITKINASRVIREI